MRSKLGYFFAYTAVFFSLIFCLYHLAYVNKIFPRVWAGQTELSNLTLNQAEARLTQVLPSSLPRLKLVFGNQEWSIDPTEINLNYSPQATGQKAFLLGRGQGIFPDLKRKWQLWIKGETLAWNFNFDEAKLEEQLQQIINSVNEAPILPALVLEKDGQITLIPGKNGRLVDEPELEQILLEHFGQLNFNTVNLPVRLTTVAVTEAQLAAGRQRAELIKDKTLTLRSGEFVKKLKGQELVDLIGWDQPWNEEKINSLIANLGVSLNRPAQDALFQFEAGRVKEFRPAKDGIKVDEAVTKEAIIAALSSWEPVEISIATSEPRIKTSEVNQMGIRELIGKGESYFYHSIPGRIHNVALTAAKLNGVLVAPGETFSFNQTVGDVSKETGYQPAYVIKSGRTVLDDGGGVCQVSTTLFRAALATGVKIVERRAHAYRVSYYETNSKPGFDATVFAPSPDLRFVNDTPAYILIQTTVDLKTLYLKIELYGASDGRQITISNVRLWDQTPPPEPLYQDDPTLPAGTVKQVDWPAWGAKAAFDWTVERSGEILQQKTWLSSYQPWQAIYLRGTGG